MQLDAAGAGEVVTRLRAAGCVFAEEEAQLLVDAAATGADLDVLVGRRVTGEPLEHVVGWAQFAGRRVPVDVGVFVPRRRSEFLVECAAASLRPGATLVDACCGSGAIGAAVAGTAAGCTLFGTDLHAAAIGNAQRVFGAAGTFLVGDLLDPLPPGLAGHVDMIVASAPYVPSGALATMPAEARDHERRSALDGGPDGLAVYRRLAAQAGRWLRPGGRLMIETAERQADDAVRLLTELGFSAGVQYDEDRGATVVTGRSSGRPG